MLTPENPLGINFYKPLDETENSFRLKVYQHDTTIPLSDVLPILENLGLRAISERPYVIKFEDGKVTWINDFAMQYNKDLNLNLMILKNYFKMLLPESGLVMRRMMDLINWYLLQDWIGVK